MKTNNFAKFFHLGNFILPLLLIFFVLSFVTSSPHFYIELFILAAIIYIAQALAHHHFDKSLTLEVVVEYILIATLAIVILLGQII